jgi:acid phosphatase type 7
MRRIARRTAVAVGAGALTLGAVASAYATSHHGSTSDWPYDQSASSVVAVVGDIGCEPNTPDNTGNPASLKCDGDDIGSFPAEYATADQIEGMQPTAVALLGDEQYQVGKLSDFENSFDKTYGAFKFLERPAPGNHEYYAYTKHGDNEAAQNGLGYFSYFNGTDANGAVRAQGQAGDDTANNQGWYSYNIGSWHFISLNAECDSDTFKHNCDPTSGLLGQETQWLAQDLAADHSPCTAAYWHQPTFTATGAAGTGPYAGFASNEGGAADAWWKLLYQHHADLVLNGHEHVYARFQPLDPAGNVDSHNGIRQFIVGTGGEDLDTLSTGQTLTDEHVVTGQDQAYGVMKLSLRNNGYSWDYRPALATAGADSSAMSYSDSGSAICHDSGD